MHYLFFNQVWYTSLETIYDWVYININKREFFEYVYSIKEKYVFVFYNNGGSVEDWFKLCKAKDKKYEIKF